MSSHQDALLEVIKAMVEARGDRKDLFLHATVRAVRDRVANVHRVILYEYDENEQSLAPRALSPSHPEDSISSSVVQMGAQVAKDALQCGTQLISDLQASSISAAQEVLQHCRSLVCVRVATHEFKFGVLVACSEQANAFSKDAVQVLEGIAGQVAILWRSLELLRETAATDERNRMLRDLHDNVQQLFPALRLELGTLRRLAEGCLPNPNAERLVKKIEELIPVSQAAGTAIRVAVRGQFYPTLEKGGLRQAIHEYLGAMKVLFFDKEFRWEIDELCELVCLDDREHWFLIMQEAICNVIRHSGAKVVDVFMGPDPNGSLILRIRDDGRGFDRQTLDVKPRSGISNMQWRANQLGARFDISSVPNQGVVVQVVKELGGTG